MNRLDISRVQVFDKTKNDFVVMQKDDMLDILLRDKINDLEDFYSANSNKLHKRVKQPVRKYLDKLAVEHDIDDSQYIKNTKNNLKNLMYNQRNMINETRNKFKLIPKSNKNIALNFSHI